MMVDRLWSGMGIGMDLASDTGTELMPAPQPSLTLNGELVIECTKLPPTSTYLGAHVGGVNASHDETMPLTKQYGWHGLLVEPNPFLFKELVRKYKDWPNLYFAQVN